MKRTSIRFRIFNSRELHEEPARIETLTQDIIKVGRLPSSHLRIEDEDVSRMHAVIEVDRDDVFIIDLGSATGTFVNGMKVNKARLRSNDEIVLGNTRVVITIVTTEK